MSKVSESTQRPTERDPAAAPGRDLVGSLARGLAVMQGRTGPFWGHNAIVRTRAFAESCGLPVLAGKPPFGGHILSHDYVEAAMLARKAAAASCGNLPQVAKRMNSSLCDKCEKVSKDF